MHPVPGEHGVCVPVDEAGQDAHAGAVDDLGKVVVARGVFGGDLVSLAHVLNDSADMPKKRDEKMLFQVVCASFDFSK